MNEVCRASWKPNMHRNSSMSNRFAMHIRCQKHKSIGLPRLIPTQLPQLPCSTAIFSKDLSWIHLYMNPLISSILIGTGSYDLLYPNPRGPTYNNNEDVWWCITASTGKMIQITLNYWNMEPCCVMVHLFMLHFNVFSLILYSIFNRFWVMHSWNLWSSFLIQYHVCSVFKFTDLYVVKYLTLSIVFYNNFLIL
jgi:hypothetical protein